MKNVFSVIDICNICTRLALDFLVFRTIENVTISVIFHFTSLNYSILHYQRKRYHCMVTYFRIETVANR